LDIYVAQQPGTTAPFGSSQMNDGVYTLQLFLQSGLIIDVAYKGLPFPLSQREAIGEGTADKASSASNQNHRRKL
jgi:hypothetical protein